jgi:hypothetical protein
MEEGKDTVYTMEISRRGRTRTTSGTLAELIDSFGYTLETGASYQREPGNKKINRNPRNIKSFVANLNNAKSNAAANGESDTYYSLAEELNEMDPDMPAVRDRVRGIRNDPAKTGLARPELTRSGQRSRRNLRSKYGAGHKAPHAMPIEEELSPENQKRNDELLAKMKAEREWSRSSRKSGSRLTGKGRGTDDYARSCFAGISEEDVDEARPGSPATNDRIVGIQNNPDANDDAEPSIRRKAQKGGRYLRSKHGMGHDEPHAMPFGAMDENKLVNVHEDVDSFLDLYKEFTIRTDKK